MPMPVGEVSGEILDVYRLIRNDSVIKFRQGFQPFLASLAEDHATWGR
jgi:hypothetical protein